MRILICFVNYQLALVVVTTLTVFYYYSSTLSLRVSPNFTVSFTASPSVTINIIIMD